jgi:hypothetical protein
VISSKAGADTRYSSRSLPAQRDVRVEIGVEEEIPREDLDLAEAERRGEGPREPDLGGSLVVEEVDWRGELQDVGGGEVDVERAVEVESAEPDDQGDLRVLHGHPAVERPANVRLEDVGVPAERISHVHGRTVIEAVVLELRIELAKELDGGVRHLVRLTVKPRFGVRDRADEQGLEAVERLDRERKARGALHGPGLVFAELGVLDVAGLP